MPLFGKKDKAGNLCFNFFHADGIPHFPNRFSIRVTFLDNEQKIEFKSRVNKKSQPAYIRYEQVVNYETYTDKEIIEKQKSVLGRAAIGGLFLGSLGSIIGGASGIGTKKEVNNTRYVIINYKSSQDPEEIKVLSLEIVGATVHLGAFYKKMRSLIPHVEAPKDGYL